MRKTMRQAPQDRRNLGEALRLMVELQTDTIGDIQHMQKQRLETQIRSSHERVITSSLAVSGLAVSSMGLFYAAVQHADQPLLFIAVGTLLTIGAISVLAYREHRSALNEEHGLGKELWMWNKFGADMYLGKEDLIWQFLDAWESGKDPIDPPLHPGRDQNDLGA